jgi:tetratricopeptide (TPR) repeat protein
MQHLEKAIEIDPDYMEAHNNLGIRYLSFDQYDKALAEFQRTVKLDPASEKGYSNLSSALAILRRFPEAEVAARRAVQLDPSSIQASYILGQILAAEGKYSDETIARLERAVVQFPKARVVLARIMVRQGRKDEAVENLREYLKSGNPEKRQEVESWIARLQP